MEGPTKTGNTSLDMNEFVEAPNIIYYERFLPFLIIDKELMQSAYSLGTVLN